MLKLFDLYDIEQVFVCSESLAQRGLAQADLVIEAQALSSEQLKDKLQHAGKLLSFWGSYATYYKNGLRPRRRHALM